MSRRLLVDRRVGVALAAAVFAIAWAAFGHTAYGHRGSSDVIFYQPSGLKMRGGELPYRDFAVEYPPGALPAFVAPTYVGDPHDLSDYEHWFGRLMLVLGVCSLLLVASARPPIWGLAFVAISPVLIGSLAPERFDLWPTALTVAAVVAFLGDRHKLGWAALAAAFAAKIYPLSLVPLAAVWTFRRKGAVELGRGVAVAAVVTVIAFGPFVILAPHGLWQSVWGQAARPMQIESLAASYLMTVGSPHVIQTYGTLGIRGHPGITVVSVIAQVVALLAIWIAFARGAMANERFVRFAAAGVCAFVAFGRVFSPQYLIWLVPLVALVRGRRGILAVAALTIAFVCTDLWYGTDRFGDYVNARGWAWLVLGRNLVIVSLAALLCFPAWSRWTTKRRTPEAEGLFVET